MRYKLIVNPLAGRGLSARSLPRIEDLLSERGLDFDVAATTRAGEAVELARQAALDGYEAVVAVGGDGTYHEVINGMMSASNGDLTGALGMIPVGSACDLSWAVGIPPDLEGACERLARRQIRVIDLVRVSFGDGVDQLESRYFDNTLGIGFDAVATVESRKIKYLRGMALYLPVVLKTVFLSLNPPRSVIEYENEGVVHRVEKTVMMVTVCNGPREGGGFYIAPEAKNYDGILDLCLADNMPRLQILGLVPHFMKGTHVGRPGVTMAQATRVTITSDDPLIAHVDGEVLCTDAHRIECEIVPQRLQVIC